jgi:secreted trypsin-like serine protease
LSSSSTQMLPEPVIGGKNVQFEGGSFPYPHYMLGLYFNGNFICGASMISQEYAVTAAHCLSSTSAADYFLRSGDLVRYRWNGHQNVRDLSDTGIEYDHQVVEVIKHEDWYQRTMNNDIALLKFQNSGGGQPIPLFGDDPNDRLEHGEYLLIQGWGKVRHPGDSHHTLQYATLEYQSKEKCEKDNRHLSVYLTDGMLCAGTLGEITSGCHGDSGGPLVATRQGRQYLVGVVSYGDGECDSTRSHTVFARVTHYLSWIRGKVPLTKAPLTVTQASCVPKVSCVTRATCDRYKLQIANGCTDFCLYSDAFCRQCFVEYREFCKLPDLSSIQL